MEEAVQTQTAPPRGNAPLFANRDLLRLLWPLVIEQTLAALVGMSDTVMVSSVGEAAISGVSLVDMINNLIINVFAALATGGAVVTSQFLGARKPQDASRSAGLPPAVGYPGASAARRRASWTTAGVGSTGVPMDKFARPPGWARARSAYGASWSHG